MRFNLDPTKYAPPFFEVSDEIYREVLQGSQNHPSITMHEDMAAFAISRQYIYQNFWTDQTAHSAFRPLPTDMPISYGQCVPSSCILHEELSERYPLEQFALHSGRVREVGQPKQAVMDSHVWVTWVRGKLNEDVVIDITADQSLRLPPVVAMPNDYLAEEVGLVYHSYRSWPNSDALLNTFEAREPDIRQRVNYLSVAMDGVYCYALQEAQRTMIAHVNMSIE